jgi:hypothetical protein
VPINANFKAPTLLNNFLNKNIGTYSKSLRL